MATRTQNPFTTVRTEGGILPVDLLQRVAEGDAGLGGLTPDAYHLSGEKINEAVSRSWQRLLGAWTAFRAAAEKLSESDLGTSLTREKWLLPLFQELGYGRLLTTRALQVEGDAYPVSHLWQHTPIHLLGFRVDLERRTAGVAGAAQMSPHGMVQELLNRSYDHLWAFVSNGHRLRILRDSVSIARPAYLEWDVEAMMEGEVYPDFVLLWLLCHQSRVEAAKPGETWLERWMKAAQEQGTRVLEKLREGVEQAINALGRGFLAHPANRALKDRLRSGDLDKQEYYRQLLRQVYRILFLFVAEDRGLLLDPGADAEARRRFQFYSTAKLRRLAERRTGTRHGDLLHGLRLVMRCLGEPDGCPALGLPALGSFLFSPAAASALDELEIANHDLLDAIRALAFTQDRHGLRPVDFRNLGSRELGSVYESLLELHPLLNVDAGTFHLDTAGGNERKTTGSYYTPESLIQALLDTALDPVLDDAARAPDPARAILNLKVCDPACGSGHFLISASHRIARRLAQVRSPEEEPSPEALRHAHRDVIGHCLYGVDLNPMAVELCKVSLWMEALEPGRPLSFLDHRIRVGNSLLGATPALLRQGIPDDAFKPIKGDDPTLCREFRKQNRQERQSEQIGFFTHLAGGAATELSEAMAVLDALPDESLEDVRRKEAAYAELVRSGSYARFRRLADAWCAAFVWKKTAEFPYPITEDVFRAIERNPEHLPSWMRDEIERLREQYQFFHWHLAFPDVFRVPDKPEVKGNDPTGWDGGFDVVLGNPPWERIKLQEKEWFAARAPEIANASIAAARKRMIAQLETENPALFTAFLEDRRKAEGESHLVRDSGRFPLCGRGDVNTYTIFAETNRQIAAARGRVGCIVPSGIATDDTTKFFFQDLVETGSLVSLYDFENRANLFPEVDSRIKFCLLTMRGLADGEPVTAREAAEFAFFLHDVTDLADEERRFTLSAGDIALLNPNTRTCPIFRTRRDAEITKAIYRRVPVLIDENRPDGNVWGIDFLRMFDMSNDSGLFRTREQMEAEGYTLSGNQFRRHGEVWLPLYEAKMLHHFDHRWATYIDVDTRDVTSTEKNKPCFSVLPRYWVAEPEVEARLEECNRDGNLIWRWDRGWLLGWRDICRSTDERTVLCGVFPRTGVGNNLPVSIAVSPRRELPFLAANLTAFALDFGSRPKLGGVHLNFFISNQLAVLKPGTYAELIGWNPHTTGGEWLLPRILELTYTAWDLQPFAEDCGYFGPPFRWDEARRFLLRCELDAAFFHLYGIERDDVDYIMETFPIVKRKDEAAHGEYRTKRVILEMYDAMAEAAHTGEPYGTRLDPPPADPRVAHPESTAPDWLARPVPHILDVPDLPARMPAPHPYEVHTVVWALLHAAGGALPRLDLARAFVLRSRPAMLVRHAPAELAPRAQKWAERVTARNVAGCALAEAVRQLAERQGVALTVDAHGRSLVTTTEHTQPESHIDEWYRFEARLALSVLATSATDQQQAIEADFSTEDRTFALAGAA